MSEKIQIHQFDPVIYPYKLWVTIADRVELLQERFYDNKGKELEGDIKDNKAVTCEVILKEEPKYKGVLIAFTKEEYMTFSIVAHEAYHASESIWGYIQEKYPSEEATAYLIGWIADCCEQVKLNKFK